MQPIQTYQITCQIQPTVQTDDLKISIQMLINELENSINRVQTIPLLTQRFNIKRRRLYDLINVFSSIGCCKKSGFDHLVWYGKSQLPVQLEKLKKSRHIDDPSYSLEQLFPVTDCIGISNLTVCFLLLFFALKTNCLDLRFVSNLFSRQTSRYKTTKCKLYQISYIFGAVGITNRTNQVCEVILNPPYYNDEILPHNEQLPNPFSISSLLNHPTDSSSNNSNAYIYKRRKDFHELFVQSIASKSLVFP